MGYEEGYQGWENWQTWYTEELMTQSRSSYNLIWTLVNIALRTQKRTGESQVALLAKKFARLFKHYRDRVKKQWDEDEADALQARGDFEIRQIEGKKPEPTGDFAQDWVNETWDILRGDMGMPGPRTWTEPNWTEIATYWLDEAQTNLEAEQEAKGIVPGEEQGLPPDITQGLKAMGIKGSKEASMAVTTKVAYTLKGHRFVSALPSSSAAKRFVKAAQDKWGMDFSTKDDGSAETMAPGVNILDAAVKPVEAPKAAASQSDTFKGRWFMMAPVGGDLQIMATPEGKEEAAALMDKPTDYALAEFLEEATANGWEWKAPEELGALTSAPIISSPAGNVYWHQNYQVEDPIETLASGKVLSFDYAGNLGENEFTEDGVATTPGGEVMASAKHKVGRKMRSFDLFFPEQVLREFYPKVRLAAFNFSPAHVQQQVAVEFKDEIPGNTVDKVNPNTGGFGNEDNSPMLNPEISGDMHTVAALEDAFDNLTKLSYISTSPAAGAGLGRDFKPQTLEGQPFRSDDEIKGGMFDEEFHAQQGSQQGDHRHGIFAEEFYQNYDMGPGGDALSHLSSQMKRAGMGNAKEQFGTFLKRVMAEVAATMISAYKVTSRPPLDKIPGTGELQLDQIEQQQYQGISSLSLNVTKSRVKYLAEKLTDSDLQEILNDSWAQAAVWCSSSSGGYVWEIFVRAETLDSESLRLTYKFVTGTRDSKAS
jgi:hypothetical protein